MLRRGLLVLGLLVIGLVLWAMVPYLLSPTILLGPCGRDWTSPSSFLPRASPTESLDLELDGVQARLCYGSPSARGREVFGELVPWQEPWRTGANEPTRLFTDGPLVVAGISLPAGRYSIYTVPGQREWQVFVNPSTFHWGNDLGASVRSREIGPSVIASRELDAHVEVMRFTWDAHTPSHAADASAAGTLTLEWERTALDLPLEAQR